MKILYFAWLKEHTGHSSEELQLPDGVDTVGALIPHITKQSPGHGAALANLDAVRVAVNRVYGDLSTPITNHDEVAFFRLLPADRLAVIGLAALILLP